MTTLTQSPSTGSLIPTTPTWTIVVDDISTSPSRTLVVALTGPGTIYQWANGVVTLAPGYAASDTLVGSVLTVNISPSAPLAQGTVLDFVTTYTDSTPTTLSITRNYVAATVLALARNPLPSTQDVAQNTPISVTFIYPNPPLVLQSVKLLIDQSVAYDTALGFTRPDYSGSSYDTNGLFTIQARRLRRFDAAHRVPVEVRALFTSGATQAMWTLPWAFDTAYLRTLTLNAGVQTTNLDFVNPRALVETFRQAALNALRPPSSTASFAVLLFYAVQHSGLSSIAEYLPGAGALTLEVAQLQARDLASPEVAYESISPVAPLFELFMRELITIGQALPEEAELLLRAWETGEAINRMAAVAAGLLYAVPLA